MIKSALEYIVGLRKDDVVEIGIREFIRGDLRPVEEPEVRTVVVSTLDGFTEFIKSEFDPKEAKGIVVIDNRCYVKFLSGIFGTEKQREIYIAAEARTPTQHFGYEKDMEGFVVWLQSAFEQTDQRDDLVKLASHIKFDNGAEIKDDGISQTTTVKTGIAKLADVELPNPVSLVPIRTFQEVKQPESDFIFRVSKGGGFTLHEGDGGAWEEEAIENIKTYLDEALKEFKGITVIA